jgi:ABC-2 type transport system permease protein
MKLIKIFIKLQSSRMGKEISLPLNTLLTSVGSGVYFIMHLIAFKLILSKFIFPGWSNGEMWALFFTFECFTYFVFFLIWRGLNHTVLDISSGKFDFIVAKPLSSKFLTLIRGGSLHNLVASCLGLVLVAFSVASFNISTTLFSWFLYLLFLFLSVWLICNIAILILSLNLFFGPATGTTGAIFSLQENMKYPSTIYSEINPFLKVLVIPMSLLVYVPTSLLLGKIDLSLLIAYSVFLILSIVLSNIVWRKGINAYSSASS